jgi:hypothetical protein
MITNLAIKSDLFTEMECCGMCFCHWTHPWTLINNSILNKIIKKL